MLLRHAKSSWDHPELSDEERPLAPRGEKVLPLMGRVLEAMNPPVERQKASSENFQNHLTLRNIHPSI